MDLAAYYVSAARKHFTSARATLRHATRETTVTLTVGSPKTDDAAERLNWKIGGTLRAGVFTLTVRR